MNDNYEKPSLNSEDFGEELKKVTKLSPIKLSPSPPTDEVKSVGQAIKLSPIKLTAQKTEENDKTPKVVMKLTPQKTEEEKNLAQINLDDYDTENDNIIEEMEDELTEEKEIIPSHNEVMIEDDLFSQDKPIAKLEAIPPEIQNIKPIKYPVDKQKVVASISMENVTVGEVLHDARSALQLSLSQVYIMTKIPEKHIAALERNDFSLLPPFVYKKAYIKTLTKIYNFSTKQRDDIINNLKNNDTNVVPSEILKNLEKEKLDDFENTRKVKNIVNGFLFIIFLFITGAFLFFYLDFNSNKNLEKSKYEDIPAFSQEKLFDFIPKQIPAQSEFDIN